MVELGLYARSWKSDRNSNLCCESERPRLVFGNILATNSFWDSLTLARVHWALELFSEIIKESWARIIDREKIRFVMFYTPQMQVFTMTESFKKANFKNLINMTCGGASLSKVTRTGIEQFILPPAACNIASCLKSR